jgi:hypothetical protein
MKREEPLVAVLDGLGGDVREDDVGHPPGDPQQRSRTRKGHPRGRSSFTASTEDEISIALIQLLKLRAKKIADSNLFWRPDSLMLL